MKELNQFILVRIEKDPKNPNKNIKKPVNAQGVVSNAFDRRNWMSFDDATAAATKWPGHKVGFVLTADDPYFCVDIDHCLDEESNSWNRMAQRVCLELAGAFVEISDSQRALHIWGMADIKSLPPHGNKNIAEDLEFYTKDRFIVMGSGGQGNPHQDCTQQLISFLDIHFAPKSPVTANGRDDLGWTVGPVAEWAGEADDEELLKKAMRSQSAQSAFGWKATFRNLWEADEDALSRAYPHADNGYDRSSADAGLAQHLAFWTGRDCERTQNLMLRSELVRDKWDDRPDYLARTVMNACARQENVDQSGASRSPLGEPGEGDNIIAQGGFVPAENVVDVFKGCIYVLDQDKALLPDGDLVNERQFNNVFNGRTFAMNIGGRTTTKKAWEAFTQHEMFRMPVAKTTVFLPDHPPLSMVRSGGKDVANVWTPPRIGAAPGDASRFQFFMERAYPIEKDRDILLSYMAAVLQYPGHKFMWAPVLQGPKGSGKSFLAECIVEAFGMEYCHVPNSEQLVDKNNGWMHGKIFAKVDELRVNNRTDLNTLKRLITERNLAMTDKWIKTFAGNNFVNFMFTTNDIDAVHIDENERRFCPFQQRQKDVFELDADGLNPAFWHDMYQWARALGKYQGQDRGFDIISQFLLDYKINEEFNPAGMAVRAPHSSSWDLFVRHSAGIVEQEIMELAEQGAPGFNGGWVSSMALDKFLTSRRLHTRVPQARRTEMLESLGYRPHPGLKGGRATASVYPDCGRPRLYVKKGHISENEETPAKICTMYEKAQEVAGGGSGALAGVNSR